MNDFFKGNDSSLFLDLGVKHWFENQLVWLTMDMFQLRHSYNAPCSLVNTLSWTDFYANPASGVYSVEYTLEEYLIAYSAISSSGKYYETHFNCLLKAHAENRWKLDPLAEISSNTSLTFEALIIIVYFKNKGLVAIDGAEQMALLRMRTSLLYSETKVIA